jgi:hypothetical protein
LTALFLCLAFGGAYLIGVNALILLGWQVASKKNRKTPQATCTADDNYYEGSLGHTRRMPGPEAAVSHTRGIGHGINR